MTKGLIGLVIPVVTVTAYLLWTREPLRLLSPAMLAAGAVPLAVLGGWVGLLAARSEGACFVRDFLVENHVKRFLGGGYGGHEAPFWYYLLSLATDYLPWSLFVPSALISLWPGWRPERAQSGTPGPERAQPEVFLFSWLLPPFLLLSMSASKRSIYLLPLAPAMALLVAAWWRSPRRAGPSRSESPPAWGRFPAGSIGCLLAGGRRSPPVSTDRTSVRLMRAFVPMIGKDSSGSGKAASGMPPYHPVTRARACALSACIWSTSASTESNRTIPRSLAAKSTATCTP